MIDFSQVTDILLGNTPVEQVSDSRGNVLWSSAPVVLPNYFYIEDASGQSNTVSITKSSENAPTIKVFKSTDGTNWESMGSTSTTAITATVPANGKLYLKATANAWNIDYEYNYINASGNHNIGGNIMSLIYGDNFSGKTEFPASSSYNFSSLFSYNTELISAANLILPATTLATQCYSDMFTGCTSLTAAPELPATTLANNCYSSMFRGCTSLTTAPALPATTLDEGCYQYMFGGCTSLTTAPELPATTLVNSCYSNMFYGCTSLTQAPVLPVTTLADYCYGGMFNGCTKLTTAPALPATTLNKGCYSGMFSRCTSLTTAPALPATTLATYCYMSMFQGCTSLTQAPVLPVTTLANGCYYGMFNGCTSLTAAPELPATILTTQCYYSMFYGCTSLTNAPALPATTLTTQCYSGMFRNCTNLNSIITYATSISATNCLQNWLNGVASTGTFHNIACTTYPSGASGIPTGWTEVHTTGSTINVTITNTSNYSGATYQIDSDTAQPINETGTTSFAVPVTATTLTIHRNGKGVTEVGGICGIYSDTDWDAAFPVNKMTDNVSIDIMSLM